MHISYENRIQSDCEDFVQFSREDVEQLFVEMKEFIAKIEEIINN